jgi:hypothetical protein
MNAVVCYLRESEKFSQDHVLRLKSMVERNLFSPFQFLCLTSSEILGVSTLAPSLNLPLWWGKLELFFHPEIVAFDNILYFDLDTVIVGRIDEMMNIDCPLAFLEDFLEPWRLATGVMFWQHHQLEGLKYVPIEKMMYQFPGDQQFLRVYMQYEQKYFIQDRVSGIYSYKVHCENGLPEDAKVVCFHGKPWIQDVKDEWVKENWR